MTFHSAVCGVLLASICAPLSQGQEILGTVGSYRRYLDEAQAATYGAAFRMPISRRFSIRPEVLADNHKWYPSLLLLGSLTGDFTDPRKPVVGYWVVSAGAIATKERSISFDRWHWAALAGVGARMHFGRHWTGAAEFRVGALAFPLVTFNIGYRWPKDR